MEWLQVEGRWQRASCPRCEYFVIADIKEDEGWLEDVVAPRSWGERCMSRCVLRADESCQHGYLEAEPGLDPGCCDSAAKWVELPHLAKDSGGRNSVAKQVVLHYLAKDPGGMDFGAEQAVLPYLVEDPCGMKIAVRQVQLPDLVKDSWCMGFAAQQVVVPYLVKLAPAR